MSDLAPELRERARQVRALILDVDGVLTDGRLYYGEHGEAVKAFHVRDGLGIRLLLDNEIQVAVITARRSPALAQRMADLRIDHFFQGADDKMRAFEQLRARMRLESSEFAFVGDDILDLPLLRTVGLPITVADGHPLVRRGALWITRAAGGQGAVREIADALLEAQGGLVQACERLLADKLGQGVLDKA